MSSQSIETFGIAALGLLLAWLLGGLLLRLGGLIGGLAGAFGIVVLDDAAGILVAAIGLALWLAGHWHYALRHQEYKSPLARQIFCRWAPAWLDPTRGWALPVAAEKPRDEESG